MEPGLELDWRASLKLIIAKRFGTRYKFCKAAGIDQGYLSSVLKGKKNFSVPVLLKILDTLGYKMVFAENEQKRGG